MRVVWILGAGVGLAAVGVAGWVVAQPSDGMRARTSATAFRRAAIVEVPATQVTRSELASARLRPQAVTLRNSLAQMASARVDLRAVDRSRVPVLVAARPALVSSLRVFPRGDSFSASAREPGVSVVIDGAKATFAAPATFRLPAPMKLQPLTATPAVADPRLAAGPRLRSSDRVVAADRIRPEMARQPRPAPAPTPAPGALEQVVVEETEYGVDVSFVRFGAAYNVSIACDSPRTDPNCTPEGATTLVRQFEAIGGGEAP